MNYVCDMCLEPLQGDEQFTHVCPRLNMSEEKNLPVEEKKVQVMNVTNPKDLQGAKKVSISKLPATAIAHAAHAMMNGADKYGPYNWRAKNVQAGIYVDAAMRHLMQWFEGEELAEDSGVHHLGHAMACCAILLDAQENDNLVDDRPQSSNLTEVLERLSNAIQRRKQ